MKNEKYESMLNIREVILRSNFKKMSDVEQTKIIKYLESENSHTEALYCRLCKYKKLTIELELELIAMDKIHNKDGGLSNKLYNRRIIINNELQAQVQKEGLLWL